jgi:hypothetical protein
MCKMKNVITRLISNAQPHRSKWGTKPNNGCYTFLLTTDVIIGNFQVFIIGKFPIQYNQEQKKKLTLKTLCFSLVQGKLYCQG